MRVVWMPGRVRTEIHLTGEDTGGAFCLLVDQPPAGWSLPAHLHLGVAETIHVVEGEFEMTVDGVQQSVGAGETIHVPPDVVHSGRGSGRRVVMFSPAGMEDFFVEAGAADPDAEVDVPAVVAAAKQHGWRFDV
jgi:quercetin dioxygenase-like cupin family protein